METIKKNEYSVLTFFVSRCFYTGIAIHNITFLAKQDGWMSIILALLAAVFAAFTSILAKIGIQKVNSNLATAIRTIVVLLMAFIIVVVTDQLDAIFDVTSKALIFLILSGIIIKSLYFQWFTQPLDY